MSVSDLDLHPGTNRWEVLRAFLKRGEARAERLVEDKDGLLILQSIPGRRNTGAIYVYRERLGAFFWLSFGEREDDLSAEDFQNALRIHKLIRFVADRPRHGHRDRYWRHAAGPVSSRSNVFMPTMRTPLVSTPPMHHLVVAPRSFEPSSESGLQEPNFKRKEYEP